MAAPECADLLTAAPACEDAPKMQAEISSSETLFYGLANTDYSEANVHKYYELNEFQPKVIGLQSELHISMIAKFRNLFFDLALKNDGKSTQAEIKRENKMSLAKALISLVPDVSLNGLTPKTSSVGEFVNAVSDYVSAQAEASTAVRAANTSAESRTAISRVNATLEGEIGRFVKQFVLKYAHQILELTDRGRRQLAEGVVARVDHQLGEKYYAYDKFSDNLWMAAFEGTYDTKLDTAKVNGVARAWRLSGLLLHCGIVRVPSTSVDVLPVEILKSMLETVNFLQRASLRDECLLLFDFYFYAARKGFEFDEFTRQKEKYNVTRHQLRAVEDAWMSLKSIPVVSFLWGYFNAKHCCQKATEEAILTDNDTDLFDQIPDYCPECNSLLGRLYGGGGHSVDGSGLPTSRVSDWLHDIDADTSAWVDEMKEAFHFPLVKTTLTDIILGGSGEAGDTGGEVRDLLWVKGSPPAKPTMPRRKPRWAGVSESTEHLLDQRTHELKAKCTMRNVHQLMATLLALTKNLEGEPAQGDADEVRATRQGDADVTLASIDEERNICFRICETKAAFSNRIRVVMDFYRSPLGTPIQPVRGSSDASVQARIRKKMSITGFSYISVPSFQGDAVLDGKATRVPPITQDDWKRGEQLIDRIRKMQVDEKDSADDRERKTRDLAFVKHLYETMIELKRIRGPCDECVERHSSLASCEKAHAGARRRRRQTYFEANPTARPLDEYCYISRQIRDLTRRIEEEKTSTWGWLCYSTEPVKVLENERRFHRLRLATVKRELDRVTGTQTRRGVRTFFKFLVAYRKASVPARRCYSALCDITMEVSECMRDMRTDSSSYLAELAVRKPLSLFVSQLYDLNRQIMEDPRDLSHNKKKEAFEENMLPTLQRDCFNLTLREHSLFYIKATAVNTTADGTTFSTRDSKASEYGFRFSDPYEMTHRIDMAGYQFFAYDELPDAAEAEIQKTFTTPPYLTRSPMAFPYQICSWTGAAKAALTTYSR
ncbi:hypothetical protein DIPPA_13467 [Diplonema papillatum]|nr:hypothetical protein DIPPA_23898 [Diplonema papillatum]KAJ9442231.1 hypothetical protein DIPPA_13467 [Diplonema papillatum]